MNGVRLVFFPTPLLCPFPTRLSYGYSAQQLFHRPAPARVGIRTADESYTAHMSGSNTICTATALLETGMVPMTEPVTKLNLDTAAGLVSVTCECRNGKCVSVEFDNVPSFVFKLDYPVDVPGLGEVKVDIVWSGMMFAVVEAKQLGLEVSSENGGKIVELGERVKRAVQGCGYVPVHPENEGIRGVTNLVVTEEVKEVEVESGGKRKWARNATVVSPGRLDRSVSHHLSSSCVRMGIGSGTSGVLTWSSTSTSFPPRGLCCPTLNDCPFLWATLTDDKSTQPCGTGTSARLAIMHARGQTAVDEPFTHASPIGTEFECRIRGVTKVGEYDAVLPTVKGKGWITSFKQVVLDDSDPFPTGFRVGDAWHVGDT